MSRSRIHIFFHYAIAAVWLVNGLYCKVFNYVPRHTEIVASILERPHARMLTILIGVAEIMMAIWTVSRFRPRLNAITQMIVIAIMNALELILVPDLLLWGKWNSVFASLFVAFIGLNEFWLCKERVDKKGTVERFGSRAGKKNGTYL